MFAEIACALGAYIKVIQGNKFSRTRVLPNQYKRENLVRADVTRTTSNTNSRYQLEATQVYQPEHHNASQPFQNLTGS